MKKFLNDPRQFVEDCLEGILAAHADFYRTQPGNSKAIVLQHFSAQNRVSVVTGGGMGHLPLFLGYLGDGLCAGAAMGNMFSTPGYDSVTWVTEQVPHDQGILYIIGNYVGDIMNFELAASQARQKGIPIRTVIVTDDIATAPSEERPSRRCISGIALIYKVAGAAAAMGCSLDEVAEIAEYANNHLGSIGVAFTPCQLPDTQTPIFSIGENEMEIGVGIHGEPGVRRTKVRRSREIAEYMFDQIQADLTLEEGDEIALMVNGLGATAQEELFILYRDLHQLCEKQKISIGCRYIGNYATTFGMNGASVSVLKLDQRLRSLLMAPSYSPLVRY